MIEFKYVPGVLLTVTVVFVRLGLPLTPLVAKCMPDGSQMVANQNQATTASQTARTVSPEAAHAASLFLDGKSPAEIVAELRGVKSSQGRSYQTALNEVTELIRQGVQS